MVPVFHKTYDGDSIVDLGRDIEEAFAEDFNDAIKKIPVDSYGFYMGRFVVYIDWIEK